LPANSGKRSTKEDEEEVLEGDDAGDYEDVEYGAAGGLDCAAEQNTVILACSKAPEAILVRACTSYA
jgi:hypothetical protein